MKTTVEFESDCSISAEELERLWKECLERFRRDGQQFDLAGRLWVSGAGWIQSIKIVRSLTGGSIAEAQHVLVQNQAWLQFALRKANSVQRCANDASLYMREIGNRSLMERAGKRFVAKVQGTA